MGWLQEAKLIMAAWRDGQAKAKPETGALAEAVHDLLALHGQLHSFRSAFGPGMPRLAGMADLPSLCPFSALKSPTHTHLLSLKI